MKNSICFLCVLLSFFSYSQDNYGFYGKKAFISTSVSFYTPMLYNTFSDVGLIVDEAETGLRIGQDKFNFGGHISGGVAVRSGIGVALEVGFDRFDIYGRLLKDSNEPTVTSHENLSVNSLCILPKLEIAGKNGLLPNGLVHQIGLGVTINKAVSKNYFRYDNGAFVGGPNADPSVADELMEENNLQYSVNLIRLLYGLKMRTPLSKSIMLNYGIRYTLDFGLKGSSMVNYDFYREVRRYQLYSVISLDFGLTFPF